MTKDIIEGLLILEKYRDDPDGYSVGAEHDVIYAPRNGSVKPVF